MISMIKAFVTLVSIILLCTIVTAALTPNVQGITSTIKSNLLLTSSALGHGIRNSHSSLSYNQKTYVIGGIHKFNSTSIAVYNDIYVSSVDSLSVWNKVPMNPSASLPARYGHATAVFPNGDFVVIGGDDYQGTISVSHNDVWQSTDQGINWKCINSNSPFSPRRNMAAVIIKENGFNSLIMAGGLAVDSGNHVHTSDVWISRDGGSTWNLQSSAINPPRADLAMVSVYNKATKNYSLLIFGGEDSPPTTFNDVLKSDDYGVTFTTITANAPWQRRFQHIALPLNQHTDNPLIVLFGGHFKDFTAGSYTKDIWISSDLGKSWRLITNTSNAVTRAHFAADAVAHVQANIFTIYMTGGATANGDSEDIWSVTIDAAPLDEDPPGGNSATQINPLTPFSLLFSLFILSTIIMLV